MKERFSAAAQRNEILQVYCDRVLKALSATRWSARETSAKAVVDEFKGVLSALDWIIAEAPDATVVAYGKWSPSGDIFFQVPPKRSCRLSILQQKRFNRCLSVSMMQ